MLKQEHDQVAAVAVERFVALVGGNASVDALYLEQLRHKIAMVLAVVDMAAYKTPMPLFIKEAVPGYDVLVYSSNNVGEELVFEPPVGAATALDPAHLDAFTRILDQEFAGKGDGVFMHEAEDGMHYVVFASHGREKTLSSLGFDVAAVLGTAPTGLTIH